jgi:hypothetical protein
MPQLFKKFMNFTRTSFIFSYLPQTAAKAVHV